MYWSSGSSLNLTGVQFRVVWKKSGGRMMGRVAGEAPSDSVSSEFSLQTVALLFWGGAVGDLPVR